MSSMSKVPSIYILLWLLIQLLIEINCQVAPFKPLKRSGHTATLIDDKLYILGGGDTPNSIAFLQFFYLDVSVSFNTQELLWSDLTSINTLPPHHVAASVKGGINNNTLFLFGGNNETMALVYSFDIQSNLWSVIKTGNTLIARKSALTGIIN